MLVASLKQQVLQCPICLQASHSRCELITSIVCEMILKAMQADWSHLRRACTSEINPNVHCNAEKITQLLRQAIICLPLAVKLSAPEMHSV